MNEVPKLSVPPGSCDTHMHLYAWVPDETMRRKILVDNPAELYGFAQ
jgi:predicted TIM-barrel fold metal-dependent hydrolase